MTEAALLPVITIGGYLGSGKTTLVNHLLRHANGRKLAVLVNEFGALPIDEDLIEAEDDSLISIAGGCICCSFGNDLVGALRDLAQIVPRPDTVLIESSGVAIPAAIVAALSLLEGYRSDGIVVVVDAETVRKSHADDYIGDTVARQLQDAEIVIANKLDLVPEAKWPALQDWLRQQAPCAITIPARHSAVAPEALLGVVPDPSQGRSSDHSDALFQSHVLRPEGPVDAVGLAQALATGDAGVVRSKGYVRGLDGALWLVQTVGLRAQATEAHGAADVGLVCLGLKGQLDTQALDALIASR